MLIVRINNHTGEKVCCSFDEMFIFKSSELRYIYFINFTSSNYFLDTKHHFYRKVNNHTDLCKTLAPPKNRETLTIGHLAR